MRKGKTTSCGDWFNTIVSFNLPLYLWVDAFLTAMFLVNWIPSSVLKMGLPFSNCMILILPSMSLSSSMSTLNFECITKVRSRLFQGKSRQEIKSYVKEPVNVTVVPSELTDASISDEVIRSQVRLL